jgi:hypothetical protein
MNRNQPPTIAKWLLLHLATSRNIEAISGDLDERYGHGHSRVWYWRQVAVAIVVSTFRDIRDHKLLTLRALIVGWFAFWFLWARLIQYGVPFIEPATQAVVEALYRSLFAGGVIGPADYLEFMSFVRSVGHVENVVWFFYAAFPILGSCIVGIFSGWIVGRLHRRKISMVLAHGTAVLVNWIGTLFLDEIGEIAPAVQVKLLRVLQDGRLSGSAAGRPSSAMCGLLRRQTRIFNMRLPNSAAPTKVVRLP